MKKTINDNAHQEKKEKENPILEAALNYARNGFSVIPVKIEDKGENKVSLVKWTEYQTKKAEEKQLIKWFGGKEKYNLAVVTGKVSNVVVVDVDVNKGGTTEGLTPTLISQTGNGWHFYYIYPGKKVVSKPDIKMGVDVRGDGGYALLPPSLHLTGRRYKWTTGFDLSLMAELPLWVLEKTKETENKRTDWNKFLENIIPVGKRNDSVAKYAGLILYNLPPALWEEVGWLSLWEFNKKHLEKPLDEDELGKVWKSIKKKELQRRESFQKKAGITKKKDQSVQILEFLERNADKITFFHDEYGEAYVSLPIDDHNETLRIYSGDFESWLFQHYFEEYGKPPSQTAINTALGCLKYQARYKGKEIQLHNRVAWYENAIWYDLTNATWEAVKITDVGWGIVDNPPTIFRRYSHQRPQVKPRRNGDISAILKYVNIQNPNLKLLLLVYIVACFIPDFPHPILNIYGTQGSAKSTLSRILKKVLDPSGIEIARFPKSEAELTQKLAHHWFLAFDNLSRLPEEISDILCSVVTGYGISKRKLYTDEEDVIFTLKRCLAINGINLVAVKSDLLERSILMELIPVKKDKRKTEKAMFDEFNKELPYLLGGIMDVVAKTLKIKPSVKLEAHERMADFLEWGCAISQALGYTQQAFLTAYQKNIIKQNKQVLFESYEAQLIMELMKDRDVWEGTPSKLLATIIALTRRLGINPKESDFPKGANILSKRLNKLKVNLEALGIKIFREDKREERRIKITKVANDTVASVSPQQEPNSEDKEGDDTYDDDS